MLFFQCSISRVVFTQPLLRLCVNTALVPRFRRSLFPASLVLEKLPNSWPGPRLTPLESFLPWKTCSNFEFWSFRKIATIDVPFISPTLWFWTCPTGRLLTSCLFFLAFFSLKFFAPERFSMTRYNYSSVIFWCSLFSLHCQTCLEVQNKRDCNHFWIRLFSFLWAVEAFETAV